MGSDHSPDHKKHKKDKEKEKLRKEDRDGKERDRREHKRDREEHDDNRDRKRHRDGKDTDRYKDHNRERHRERDRDRERDSYRERDRKDGKKDKDREKGKDQRREKDRDKESSSKDKSKSSADTIRGSEWWKTTAQTSESDSDDMDSEEARAQKALEASRRRRAAIQAKYQQGGASDTPKQDSKEKKSKKEGKEKRVGFAESEKSEKHKKHSHKHKKRKHSDSSSSDDDEAAQKEQEINKARVAKEEWRQREAEEEKRAATVQQEKEKESKQPEKNVMSPQKKVPAFDMFCDSPSNLLQLQEEAGQPNDDGFEPHIKAEMQAHLHENWDDVDGYYTFRNGEILHGKFKVMGKYGRGVFSVVLRCEVLEGQSPKAKSNAPVQQGSVLNVDDLEPGTEVAIKVIRANEHMYKTGVKEMELLKLLADHDPHNKKHIVRYIDHFEHKNHLCIVFEPFQMNMRELLKKYGKDQGKEVGISLEATRVYTKQLLTGLRHMREHSVLHADLKPDNILVNAKKTIVKLADFGSATDVSEAMITPYLVSRFYRPPEVILGLQYDTAVDMWSIATTVYELYTGRVMFAGRTNNDMLARFMSMRGRFPNKMLKRAAFREDHFNETFQFKQREVDPVSKKELVRARTITGPSCSLKQMLLDARDESDDRKKVLQLVDFLEKCLALDPAQRMRPEEGLRHPFLADK
eukprot:TRINITY_DN64965_c0_g1_i1.p1 TRINITY_DN64965_c0_g1~~TRINITY_DN64965_c0_g1_i1.p1  ORF type:complete len:692 (+),score=85.95 TRINITY_DN64965_c0_g1_i1:38-2113(+)